MHRVSVLLFIFFIINFFVTSAIAKSTYKSITYSIKPNINEKILHINAKYQGNFSKQEVIDLPYHWGNKNYSKQIKNVHVTNKKSKFFINRKNQNQLVIQLSKHANTIEVNYDIYSSKLKTAFNIKELILYDNLVHIPGHAIFAIPENVNYSEKLNVSIIWQAIPEKWITISSHGNGNLLSFQATTHQLLHSVLIAGKFRKYKSFINGKAIYFSLYGTFDFIDKEIIENTTKIIKSQREFFNDYKFNNYLISIIENPDGDQKTALMGGISLHNSFVVHLSKNITLLQLKLLFAHEHFHNWIGNQIYNSEEGLNYWWSEGFTDYYAIVLSLKYGIISIIYCGNK